jgi:hypothetical protein
VTILISYVDPGTGSFVLQAVVGAVMGATYLVRGRVRLIIAKLRGRKKDAATANSEEK